MRQHGHASIDPTQPAAKAVCDRCGFLYSHRDLRWQSDWRGPRLQNLRLLVCQSCLDTPQMNGQRTILIPPDPIPIQNARPEMYVSDDNPMSAIGANPFMGLERYGSRIGTMNSLGGINAAFDGNANKPTGMCATISVSNSSYNNYVGINWSGRIQAITAPSSLLPPVITHSITSFTVTAPNDSTFGSSAFVVQGSPVDAGWGSWTTLYSAATSGTVGETISGQTTGGRFQFARVAFLGDGVNQIAVSQVSFNVGETG